MMLIITINNDKSANKFFQKKYEVQRCSVIVIVSPIEPNGNASVRKQTIIYPTALLRAKERAYVTSNIYVRIE